MKVNFRSNDKTVKGNFELDGGIELYLQPLSKFLSEDALFNLSVLVESDKKTKANLDIMDGGLKLHAVSEGVDAYSAVNAVVKKSNNQLLKNKSKSEPSREILDYEEEFINENVINDVDITSAERALRTKEKSARYKRTMDKYVDYLYLESEIERVENQLAQLYYVKDAEFNTLAHIDFLALEESIKQLKREINFLAQQRVKFENDVRVQNYVEQVIDDNLNVLSLKRR